MALTEVDAARLNDNVFNATGPYTNRIINGDMRIDQRNAGASISGTLGYITDRWICFVSQANKLTGQQNAGSVTPPTGFTHYLGFTSSSAYSSASSDYFFLTQKIEGFNVADLAWGTASAQAITLSFRVYSSLTGTFSGSVTNSAENRSYPFTYSVSSANTWATISVTIPGDNSGTWLTNNGTGIAVKFNLGSGSNRLGTAGAWASSTLEGATGSVSVVGTNGATFYITGVQLEAGSVATPFERRSYGQELSLCQRYCPVFDASISFNGTAAPVGSAFADTTSSARTVFVLPVTARVPPTGATVSSGAYFSFTNGVGSFAGGSFAFNFGSTSTATMTLQASSGTVTAATGGYIFAQNSSGKIVFNGCEL